MLFPPKDVPTLIVDPGMVVVNNVNPEDRYDVIGRRWVRDGMLGSGHTEHLLRRRADGREGWFNEPLLERYATIIEKETPCPSTSTT